jgi:hypothetical protein
VEAMIVDTTSLSVMVQSIGLPHKDGEKVRHPAHCLTQSLYSNETSYPHLPRQRLYLLDDIIFSFVHTLIHPIIL